MTWKWKGAVYQRARGTASIISDMWFPETRRDWNPALRRGTAGVISVRTIFPDCLVHGKELFLCQPAGRGAPEQSRTSAGTTLSTPPGPPLSWFRVPAYPASAEFLENYRRDALVRWSPGDLAAQGEFVNAHLAGRDWLDWSSPAAALQLVQSGPTQTVIGESGRYDALVLAGPIVELVEPPTLFGLAAAPLRSGGKLIGIMPCLRDNSPESREFMGLASSSLWPYFTAEELLEMLSEAGWKIEPPASGFVAIPRFNQAVLKGEPGFRGFAKIFEQLMAGGYDPAEVGWGELRLLATRE